MHFSEVLLLGAALAMDALAVSVALGAAQGSQFRWKNAALAVILFGFFQFFMPLAGFVGSSFAEHLIANYGNIAAGILLMIIGGKMFMDRNDETQTVFSLYKIFTLAIATSIDALLVGVSYRCLHRAEILSDALIIGAITALICAIGCLAGRWSGKLLGKHCATVGALVLVIIGVKVIFFG